MAPNIVGKKLVQEEISCQDINNNNNNNNTEAITYQKEKIVRQEDLEKQNASQTIVYGEDQIVIARKPFRVQLVWRNIIAFIILHSSAFYGLYLLFAERAIAEFFYCKYLIFHSPFLIIDFHFCFLFSDFLID